jgi:hypothetical protein
MKIIGIDPAFRQNGFAICILDTEAYTATFQTLKTGLLEFEDFIKQQPEAYFAIENSNLQKSFFGRRKLQEACSVGKNQAVSQLAVGFVLKHYGKKQLHDISPLEKGRKITSENIFEAYMQNFTLIGYKGSQDEKDAAKIALLGKIRQILRNGTIVEPAHLKKIVKRRKTVKKCN